MCAVSSTGTTVRTTDNAVTAPLRDDQKMTQDSMVVGGVAPELLLSVAPDARALVLPCGAEARALSALWRNSPRRVVCLLNEQSTSAQEAEPSLQQVGSLRGLRGFDLLVYSPAFFHAQHDIVSSLRRVGLRP